MRYIPPGLRIALLVAVIAASWLLLLLTRERRRSRRVQQDALRDRLTGLANRLAFDHRSAIEWERARRYSQPLGVLVLDLDGFKQVNDSGGHLAGDRLLRDVARALARRVRRSDLIARLGGDEFVVLAVETASDGLEVLARSLERAVEGLPVELSVGWAERAPGDREFSNLLDRADRAMYRQKQGRPMRGVRYLEAVEA